MWHIWSTMICKSYWDTHSFWTWIYANYYKYVYFPSLPLPPPAHKFRISGVVPHLELPEVTCYLIHQPSLAKCIFLIFVICQIVLLVNKFCVAFQFRTYDALRREHDSQIVQIALEAGLRISPEQWSALLYGDQGHKSHMQSIIDKVHSTKLFILHNNIWPIQNI